MPTPIENILTSIGLPADEISQIMNVPETDHETFDPQPFINKVKTNYQTQFKNDPAFFNELTVETLPVEVRKKLESNQYGRAANITREKLLKGLGLTEADYSDFTPEQKEKLELFVPALAEKYAKNKAGDKQLQNDLIEARRKLEEFSGQEETFKTRYESEANQKISAAIFNAALISELSSIPGLKIPASDIAKTAAEIVNSKFAFERVGDFSIELRNKENPTMKVLKKDSSHEVTLKDVLTDIATERGWLEAAAGGSGGSGKVKVDGTGGKLNMQTIPPHLQDKIGRKIASEA